jgi:hypothetical protein
MTDARLEAIRELMSVLEEHADDTPPALRGAVERLIEVLVAEDLDRRDSQTTDDRKAAGTLSASETV